MAQSRSKDKRAVYLDTTAAARLLARYLVPAPVWKSSYRLLLPDSGEATLEGWAIVDNASGEDWSKVDLTVVSGKPVSFVTSLYEPRYLQRPSASLPDDQPVAPVMYDSAMASTAEKAAAPTQLAEANLAGGMYRRAAAAPPPPAPMAMAPARPRMASSLAVETQAREAGELFEYHFATPVTAHKGESMLLPFVQQKLGARKLLVYSDRSQPNPRNAAEISNSTGKDPRRGRAHHLPARRLCR